MRYHRLIALSILSVPLSAVFLTLAFPAAELHYLAWVALVPLFLLLRKAGPMRAFLYFFATGFLFYSALIRWTLTVNGVNPFNFCIGNLATAWYFGAFGIAAYYLRKNNPRWIVLTYPAAWTILEFLKSHLGFLSVPWGTLGYSQYSVLTVAGFSAFAGVYGVSFLIVAANTVFSEIISYYLAIFQGGDFRSESLRASLRTSAYVLFGAVSVFVASILYGSSHASENSPPPVFRVAVIQGNLYSNERADDILIEKVSGKYRDLALSAAASKPDLIAWPSSSVPGRIPFDPKLVSMLSDTAQKSGSFLLAGTSRFDKFNPAQKKRKRVSNSAFLFSPQGKILGKYDKIRLLPFDQYLPLRGYVHWPSWIVSSSITDHEPGRQLTVFRMRNAEFGVQICWENMFPDQFREMAARGVDFMVSMTNEGFVGLPVAHHQLLAINVFRAIENHVAIVRPAATGVSCLIDPDGRIIVRVSDPHSNDVNIEGFQVGQISLSRERTFYTRFGDLFVYILSVLMAGLVLKNIVGHKYNSGECES